MPQIIMKEPLWWYYFMKKIVDLWTNYPRIERFYPIGADVFVFIYPVFLVILYLYGIFQKKKSHKASALFIFFSCLISVIVTIISQQFLEKQRPIYEFALDNTHQETLLHSFLPSTSFPSDHAVVSFSIAMATLLIALRTRNKTLKIWAGMLFLFAIIMGMCRIGTTVHRTTDIIAWAIMGILIPTILMIPWCFKLLEKWLIAPSIRLEEWIVTKLFGKKSK